MLDLSKMHAIGMIAARQARERASVDGISANEVIDMTALLKQWVEGPHTAGEVVVHDASPYKVVQTHDSTGNPTWNPKDAPSLFAPFHATDKAHALPYTAPTGAHDVYNSGEWMVYTDGITYMCKQNATVHGPDVLPSAWTHN